MGGTGRNDDGVIREQGPPSFWHLVSAIKTDPQVDGIPNYKVYGRGFWQISAEVRQCGVLYQRL